MVKRVLALIVLAGLLAGCVRPEPIRPRPTVGPVATRVPALIPRPTVSPLERPEVTVELPSWGLRSVSAPDAPIALVAPESEVVNVVCAGDCITNGGPSWVTSDMLVAWIHPDPLAVDYYEVWRSTTEPYFELGTCERCELAATSTGLEALVADSPRGFNPVGGTSTVELFSTIDAYRVRACNAGGCSELSNAIAAINESLLQGFATADK